MFLHAILSIKELSHILCIWCFAAWQPAGSCVRRSARRPLPRSYNSFALRVVVVLESSVIIISAHKTQADACLFAQRVTRWLSPSHGGSASLVILAMPFPALGSLILSAKFKFKRNAGAALNSAAHAAPERMSVHGARGLPPAPRQFLRNP